MTVYPAKLDNDATIVRIDDNLTEIGAQSINQARSAIFALERTLGINPQGTAASVAARLAISFNLDGTLKASALTSVGLVAAPIVDADVAFNAAIKESKLALDYSTSDLHDLTTTNSGLIVAVQNLAVRNQLNMVAHIAGDNIFNPSSTPSRHQASVVILDPKIVDKSGALRSAADVQAAVTQVNNDLVKHLRAPRLAGFPADVVAHPATAISVDTSQFQEVPPDADTVQEVLDFFDNEDRLQLGVHRATMHANGIPRNAQAILTDGYGTEFPNRNLDGYTQQVVPPTSCTTFLYSPGLTSPNDSNADGDHVIQFNPSNPDYVFDALFAQVRAGDVVRVNYGLPDEQDGYAWEVQYVVDSVRFEPGTEWFVRVAGVNLRENATASASIERSLYNTSTEGVLAVAKSHVEDGAIPDTFIVGDPMGAVALGFEFDPEQLDEDHYLLYLALYPQGDPALGAITLPGIDVTGVPGSPGAQGAAPGTYTLDSVIQATNDAFRLRGSGFPFIAFEHEGAFGIMLTEDVDQMSFSIINGVVGSSSVEKGSFDFNVLGDYTDGSVAPDGYDALGIGSLKANVASPEFGATYSSPEVAAELFTRIFVPLQNRFYTVNGVRRDTFLPTPGTEPNGFFIANLAERPGAGIQARYDIPGIHKVSGLEIGKTILVSPAVPEGNPNFVQSDYGLFVISNVEILNCAPDICTQVTVWDASFATFSVEPPAVPTYGTATDFPVRLFFGQTAVGIPVLQMSDASSVLEYRRFIQTFVDEDGRTFSHERARMLVENESATALGTNLEPWVFRDVSPKILGVPDTITAPPSPFDRTILRLIITSYDDTTGEFEGQLGDPDPSSSTGLLKPGPVVRGQKNLPVRFYDSSYVDYIELLYNDLEPGGRPVMSDSTTRAVDIELFDRLSLDESVFYLSSASLKVDDIEDVQQRREFGTTSEEDFTNSAIDFVEAGDRLLHGNGVIRGFSFVEQVQDQATLVFDGGTALVDGTFSTVNRETMTIPFAALEPPAPVYPQELTWAVCVNDSNGLALVLITAAEDNARLVLPPAVVNGITTAASTFNDLVDHRVELTPVALVQVTVGLDGVRIDEVLDVRKYVLKETQNIELTVAEEGGTPPSNFRTLVQLTNWLRSYTSTHRRVLFSGNFEITADLDWTDLENVQVEGLGPPSSISNPPSPLLPGTATVLRFSGGADFLLSGTALEASNLGIQMDGGKIIFATPAPRSFRRCTFSFWESDIGLELSSLATFESCTVWYTPSSAPASAGFVHGEAGAFFLPTGVVGDDIVVSECIFRYADNGPTTDRYPFVSVEVQGTDARHMLRIVSCDFGNVTDTLTSCAAVAVVGSNVGDGTLVEDLVIADNTADDEQGIYVTCDYTGAGSETVLALSNVSVRGNRCGRIGLIGRQPQSESGILVPPLTTSAGAFILGNTAPLIGFLNSEGFYDHGATRSDLLVDLSVQDNRANWIALVYGANSTSGPQMSVTGNFLTAAETAPLTAVGVAQNSAIAVVEADSGVGGGKRSLVVDGNQIRGGRQGGLTSYYYVVGIQGASAARITNNVVKGTSTSAQMFLAPSLGLIGGGGSEITGNLVDLSASPQTATQSMGIVGDAAAVIQGNQLYRGARDISYFIQASGDSLVTDNTLDSPTTNGILETVISSSSSDIVHTNKNQTVVVPFRIGVGNVSVGSRLINGLASNWSLYDPSFTDVKVTAPALFGTGPPGYPSIHVQARSVPAGSFYEAAVEVELGAILPAGVQIVSADLNAGSSGGGNTYKGAVVIYETSVTTGIATVVQTEEDDITSAVGGVTVTLTPASDLFVVPGLGIVWRVSLDEPGGAFDFMNLNRYSVTYRW